MIPLRDSVRSQRFPIVNLLFIAVNILVFLYEMRLGRGLEEFFYTFGLVPTHFHYLGTQAAGLFSRMIPVFTSMFIHGGWLHLIGNMWFLWVFGDNIEDRLGHIRYILFYFLCGIVAGLAQVSIIPDSQVPMVGASGAVAGVLAAYVLFYPRAQIRTLLFLFIFIEIIHLPALVFIGIWFLFQFAAGVGSLGTRPDMVQGVAWWAHVGGFAAGFLLAMLLGNRRRIKRRRVVRDEVLPW